MLRISGVRAGYGETIILEDVALELPDSFGEAILSIALFAQLRLGGLRRLFPKLLRCLLRPCAFSPSHRVHGLATRWAVSVREA